MDTKSITQPRTNNATTGREDMEATSQFLKGSSTASAPAESPPQQALVDPLGIQQDGMSDWRQLGRDGNNPEPSKGFSVIQGVQLPIRGGVCSANSSTSSNQSAQNHAFEKNAVALSSLPDDLDMRKADIEQAIAGKSGASYAVADLTSIKHSGIDLKNVFIPDGIYFVNLADNALEGNLENMPDMPSSVKVLDLYNNNMAAGNVDFRRFSHLDMLNIMGNNFTSKQLVEELEIPENIKYVYVDVDSNAPGELDEELDAESIKKLKAKFPWCVFNFFA